MTTSSARWGARVWLWRWLWAAIVAAGLVVKAVQSPLYVFGASDDDELMVRMAQGFLHGHWSSSWSSTGVATLVKPVGFPLFLAGAHFLPWSPLVTVYLLSLAGAALTAWSWRRLSGSRPQATAVLALMVFNPIAFTLESQRVYRNLFIDAVATLAIGLAFVIAAEVGARRPAAEAAAAEAAPGTGTAHQRHPGRLRCGVPYLSAVGIGLLVGTAAITKPTWLWLPFAVAAPLAYPLLLRLRRPGPRWGALARVVLAGLLAVLSAWGVVETVTVMNQRTYGVSLVEDFSSGGLARAWGAWASVEAGPPEHGVQITRSMREAVYRVSPTAAAMEPYLESPTDFWKSVDCESSVHICDESGNWMEWDLQSAAVSTGKVNSVRQFQQYFDRLAGEIEHACATGELRCTSSPVLATGLPPLDRIPVGSVASDTAEGMWGMVAGALPMEPPDGPRPTAAQYRLWSSVLPGMAPADRVAGGTSPSVLSPVLRGLDWIYRIVNVVLVAIIVLGVAGWVSGSTVRRRRAGAPGVPGAPGRPVATVTSCLFLVSWCVGMGQLGAFDAGRAWPGYVAPIYWTDFATAAELCLVLGAIAAWPVLRGAVRGWRAERGSPTPPRTEAPPSGEPPADGGPPSPRSAAPVDAVPATA